MRASYNSLIIIATETLNHPLLEGQCVESGNLSDFSYVYKVFFCLNAARPIYLA